MPRCDATKAKGRCCRHTRTRDLLRLCPWYTYLTGPSTMAAASHDRESCEQDLRGLALLMYMWN